MSKGQHASVDRANGWTPAHVTDAGAIHALRRSFCEEEGIVFREEVQASALSRLLEDPSMGTVFVFIKADGEVSGFLVLTLGFSLEFGGRFALLDELYLTPDCRGKGLGRPGVEAGIDWAKGHGANAVRLEVNHHNSGARKLYERIGLIADGRDIFTLVC